jgi:hypothetical protein
MGSGFCISDTSGHPEEEEILFAMSATLLTGTVINGFIEITCPF